MDRRSFFHSMIGGVATAAAVRTWPFRVYSFPSDLRLLSIDELKRIYVERALTSLLAEARGQTMDYPVVGTNSPTGNAARFLIESAKLNSQLGVLEPFGRFLNPSPCLPCAPSNALHKPLQSFVGHPWYFSYPRRMHRRWLRSFCQTS